MEQQDEFSANAALVFVSGQSNAHAHAQALPPERRISEPLRNVWSLDRDPNQSLTAESVVWSGFTTAGKNLGETQDHTASLAYFLARRWQAAIDGGAKLPDLYIVQISVGSQGIIGGKWREDKAPVLVPGDHLHSDIALYPLATRFFRLAAEDLRRRFARPAVLGWHWIGSESDADDGCWDCADFRAKYDRFFDAMLAAIGQPCRTFIYKNVWWSGRKRYGRDPAMLDWLNIELLREVRRLGNAELVETDRCPLWVPGDGDNGVFGGDWVHYRPATQQWFADRFFEQVTGIKSE